jgi:hypothetical protein
MDGSSEAGNPMVSAIDPTKPSDGVPAVKADLRENLLAAKREIEALQVSKIGRGGPIDMQGQQITRAILRNLCSASTTPSIRAGILTLDLQAGNMFEVTLTENVVSLTLANPPAVGLAGSCYIILKQDSRGGRTLAWPGTIRWPGGISPRISSAENAVDIFFVLTRDGGATWYGFINGKQVR